MQTADAKTANQSASRSDEESIKFRPSPNFKNMKKYMKSKFDFEHTNENEHEKRTTMKENVCVEQKLSQQVKTATMPAQTMVQPPLPPNPPPPLSPSLGIKQEIIDESYMQMSTSCTAVPDMYGQYGTDVAMPEQELPPKDPGSERIMCRNFVRGNCKKGDACIFVHELILSQLPGVYTFCRNFQNRQCSFARCKFVHATVFEKEYFYRTGYLPPHAIAHLKAMPPPPPPPPPQPEELAAQELAHQQYYGVPTLEMMDPSTQGIAVDCSAMSAYMLQSPESAATETMMYAVDPSTCTVTSEATKRDWAVLTGEEEPSYAEAEYGQEESLPKKCKNCDSNEFRYQFHKNKVENLLTASDEVNKKLAQINGENERLCTVLMTFFKPHTPVPSLASTSDLSSIALDDKDRNLLEHMNLFMSPNNRITPNVEEEALKNLLGSNISFQSVMAKLLIGSGDQSQSSTQ